MSVASRDYFAFADTHSSAQQGKFMRTTITVLELVIAGALLVGLAAYVFEGAALMFDFIM